jgi:hypothetical protein
MNDQAPLCPGLAGRRLADWCDEEGPEGYRRAIREAAGEDRDRRIWQPSKHAEAVRSEEFLNSKIEYMHYNPVRARQSVVVHACLAQTAAL